MSNFTPLSALAGGALIGLAAAIYILGLGRVAGVSGILGSLLRPRSGDAPAQFAFVAGLIAAPLLMGAAGAPLPAISVDASLPAVIVGGVLVGYGTRLGGGCTSGHGVCGIARFSTRSLAATALFMAAGAAVVFVARHVIGG
ncbi:MAG: YeeE/YedE family protein [Candidatus Odyssella sp.]|nr:YeeE/YedE family protein [Candidatus Odyssella sp.]